MDSILTHASRSRPATFLLRLYEAMVEAANPARVLPPCLPENRDHPLRVIGAGKAAASMAAALDEHWRGLLSGWVVTPYGHSMPAGRVEVREASHPLPDASAAEAGRMMLESVTAASRAGERLVCLLSGGASSLTCLPPPGVSLATKRELMDVLLRSGAGVSEINCVRKHLSMLKGGRLAQAAWPCPVLCLGISDVPLDDPSVIGSGPFSPDPGTRADALAVLDRYAITAPATVRAWLEDPASESPKPRGGRFEHVDYRLIATPATALAAASATAERLGLAVLDLGAELSGDAASLGRAHAALALDRLSAGWCGVILSGGETGVRVNGAGRGGRNTEYLAALLDQLGPGVDIAGLAADTDGVDGSGGAGAWFDPSVLASAAARGLAVSSFRETSDTHAFFATLGSALERRPTLTNVNDFRAVLVGASRI
jgi:hydroxypyruvate reductase